MSTPINSPTSGRRDEETLEREIAQLKRSLKVESSERDTLEKENSDLERKNKQFQKKIKDLEADISHESSERDVLDRENANLEKKFRSLELELKNYKGQLQLSEETVLSLKEARQKLIKKGEDQEKEAEREAEQLRNDLRAAKREVREKTKRLEEDKDSLERELKRLGGKKLEDKVKTLEREKSDLEMKLKMAQSSSSSSSSGSTVPNSVVNQLMEEKSELEKTKDKLEEKLKSIETKAKEAEREREAVQSKQKELEDSLKALKAKVNEAEEKREGSEKDRLQLEQEMAKLKRSHRDEIDSLTSQNGNVELQKSLDELRMLFEDEKENKAELHRLNEELERRNAELKVEIAEIESNEIELLEERKRLSQKLSNAESDKVLIAELQEQLDKIKRKLTKENEALKEQLETEKKAKEKAEEKRQGLSRSLSNLSLNQDNKQSSIMTESEKAVRKELLDAQEALNEERTLFQSKEEKSKKKHESELSQLKNKVEEMKEDSNRISKEKNQMEEELKNFKKESEDILLQFEREKEAKRQSEISLRKLNEGMEEEAREKMRLKKALELATIQREESEKGIMEKLESSEKERIKTEREVSDLKLKLEEEHSKINSLKNQFSDVKSKLEQNDSQKAKKEDSVNAEKNEIERLSNQLSQLSNQANETKSLIEKNENIRKNLENDLQILNEELNEERTCAQKWKSTKDQLDQQLIKLEDELDSQKIGRESDAKAKKQLESELEKLTTEKEKIAKEKSSLEREKTDTQREISSLREEKNSIEGRKNKVEGELSSLSKKLEEESAAKEENESLVKKLNRELKELQENLNTLKSQQKEDNSSQLSDENQRLKNELNVVKQKNVELEGHGDKLITLEKKLYESKGQTEAQTLKSEKAKERKNHFKKQLQELKSQLESFKSQPISPDSSALQSENARLRAEVQALRESSSIDLDSSDALSSTGPRLSTVRRPLGPRASRNLGVAMTISAPKEESNKIEEKTPTISIEKKAAMMGGVNLFGGANLAADLLAAKSRPRSTSVAAQNMESDGRKRLWQLKGRRRIRSFQVEVGFKSLNQGDVFVLDTGAKIFQWNGSECNRLERTKGKDIVARLNRQRGSKAEIITLDQEDKDDPQMHSFWKEIGGKSGEVASTASGGDDLEAENLLDNKTRLFKVNENGPLEEVAQGKLSMEMLDSNGVFVIDTNDEVYLWFGKLSPKGSLRTIGQSQAESLLESNRTERPSFTELFKVADGGESVFFCEKFSDWPDGGTLGPQKFNSNVAASKKQEKINVESMYQSSNDPPSPNYYLAKGEVPFTVEVHVVVDAVKEEISSSEVGKFYSGHSYIITYSFGLNDKSYIIYFWQGRDGSKNEKGTSAALSMNLSKKLPGANQVRVVQGKEPADFLKLFRGKFLILKGKRSDALAKPLLVCVSAPKSSEESCATQVPSTTSSLNTGYSYLLKDSAGQDFIWNGSQSTSFSAEATKKVLEFLGGDYSKAKNVSEESTPSEFWKSLSGESDQILSKDKRKEGWINKFFLFSNASGMLTADRQVVFSQEDLSSDGIYLFDTFYNVFLWIGSKAREADKKTALETALNYLQFAIKADGRPSSVTVSNVKEGSEPSAFTSSFFGWDKGDSGSSGSLESASDALSQYSKLYSFEELKDKDKLPATVDKSQLEMYLEDGEFVKIFGMDKATWRTTPAWKKTPKKKEVGLF